MKVFITGANGMVGRNIVDELSKSNENDLLTPSSSDLNLLDRSKVENYLKINKPDLIIHCAGRVGGIQANIKEPVNFLYDNMTMGFNLVHCARELGIKKFLNFGSSCMYPRDYKNPLKEEYILDAKLEPTNEGYALAKISTAKLCEYTSREDESFLYKTIIPPNLYGYYDKFDPKVSHMIPAVIRKIHEAKVNNDKSVEIWGDGTARREFMFSGDIAQFTAFALSNLEALPSYLNVGLGYDYTILEYYQAIAKVIGFEGEFTFDVSKPVGMKQKLVDTTLLESIGWKAPTSLENGIEKTYKYFLDKIN